MLDPVTACLIIAVFFLTLLLTASLIQGNRRSQELQALDMVARRQLEALASAINGAEVADMDRELAVAAKLEAERQLIAAQSRTEAFKAENKTLVSLIDFDGVIRPIPFLSRHRFAVNNSHDMLSDRRLHIARLRIEPQEISIMLDAWDFKALPASIPHIAERMVMAMCSNIVSDLTPQLEGQLLKSVAH